MCFLYLGIREAFARLLLFFAFIYHSWHTLLYALQFKICFPVTAGGRICMCVCVLWCVMLSQSVSHLVLEEQ